MKKLFAYGAAFAVALLVQIPLVSSAAENDSIPIANSSQEVLSNEIVKYVDKSENHYFFNSYKASMSNASSDVIDAGTYFNEVQSTYFPTGERTAVPVYGNWCGPGYGKGTPVDVLDTACMHHDHCYGKQGYFSCPCGKALIQEIDANYNRMKPGKERKMASAIKAVFWLNSKRC